MTENSLPFQLGMEYENWEFDLEPIEDRIDGYDSYIYLKEIFICGVKPRRIELIFYWEVLVTIILNFDYSDLTIVQKLSTIGYKQVNNYYYKSDMRINLQIYNSLIYLQD